MLHANIAALDPQRWLDAIYRIPCDTTPAVPAAFGCSRSGKRSTASSEPPPLPLDALMNGPLQSRYSTCRCRLANRRAAALMVSMPCRRRVKIEVLPLDPGRCP